MVRGPVSPGLTIFDLRQESGGQNISSSYPGGKTESTDANMKGTSSNESF
eukprot:CAMPEP_0172201966 /NCGR_PEP_ID=MMETSP1050-20130122/30345_1 /TAXON_ID=233186 /ORGANISM="Cryptomonas curvata, Strain CCAP979/52" /LENGTH=49 /DNA_ID= /DNA_START= /DNA_END= /DNA_ORIENTATION=